MALDDLQRRWNMLLGQFENPRIEHRALTTLLFRAKDIASQAMAQRGLAAQLLTNVLIEWGKGPCPSITCGEANDLYQAAASLGVDEDAIDAFMLSHTLTDNEEYDLHILVTEPSGDIVGWTERQS